MKNFLIALSIMISITLQSQDLNISLKNGSDKEKEAKAQLERIVDTYQEKINKWLYTTKIQINENSIPFSHPILTLNCNYLNNDLKQLSTFLHEQFHWLEEANIEQREKTINEFGKLFPNVPLKVKNEPRRIYSTYLHLIVCDLEFQAMKEIIGEKLARQILSEWSHYTWVYDKVLNDSRIREINTKNDFTIH